MVDSGHPANAGRGTNQIGPEQQLQPAILEFKARGIKRTALVCDEDHSFQVVDLDEKLELIHNSLALEIGLGVVSQTGRSSGECDAIIAWELQTVLQKVVKLFADAAIGAIDGGSVNALSFIGQTAAVG